MMTFVYIFIGGLFDVSDNDGCTPLYLAAQEGHYDVVELLLKRGAYVGSMRIIQATPLYVAAQFNRVEIIQLLIEVK